MTSRFTKLCIASFVLLVSLILLTSLALPASAEGVAEPPAAVFLVRHAEKEAGNDPSLTASGHERAQVLAQVLGHAGLDSVYVTQWRRTIETAAAVAEMAGLEPLVEQTSEGFAERLAKRLLSEHPGQVVLVVGHSNTNPEVIAALGVKAPPVIDDEDYDDIFLVVFPPASEPRLVRLGYGQPTP